MGVAQLAYTSHVKFVLQNLFRRKLRTMFSVLGIGLGVSIMAALFTISDDLTGQIQEAMSTQRGDVMVIQSTTEELESDVPTHYVEQLEAIEGVTSASPMIAAFLRTDNDFDDRPAILYYGITENSPILEHMKMIEGKPISDDDPGGVVFGWKAWEIINEKMGDKAPKVGDPLDLLDVITSEGFQEVFARPDDWETRTAYQKKIWVLMHLTKNLGVHPDAALFETDEQYRKRRPNVEPPPQRKVVRVFGNAIPETDEAYFNRTGRDPNDPVDARWMRLQMTVRGVCRTGIMVQDAGVFFQLQTAQVMKGKHKRFETRRVKVDGKREDVEVEIPASCTTILLTVDGASGDPAHEKRVGEIITKINQEIKELRAIRPEDALSRHAEVDLLENFGLVISIIAALAGALGIFNVMTMAVLERTREIGLLMAVGWTRKRIMGVILTEGVVLSIIGGLAGVLFGWGEVLAARELFNLDILSGDFNWLRSGQAFLASIIVGSIATIYPAVRAATMTPVGALRHE